jgi:hypothetical protein
MALQRLKHLYFPSQLAQFFVSTTREQLRIATQNGGHVRRKDRSDRRWQFLLLFTVDLIDTVITCVKYPAMAHSSAANATK